MQILPAANAQKLTLTALNAETTSAKPAKQDLELPVTPLAQAVASSTRNARNAETENVKAALRDMVLLQMKNLALNAQD